MTTYMRRSDWTSHGPKRPLAPMPSGAKGLAFHWPGMVKGKAPVDRAAVAARLESYRVLHTSPGGIGTKDGGNDIAYQWCVDLAGRCWPLRGFEHQSGANGDGDVNRSHGAVLLMVGPDDVITPDLIEAVRDLRARHWLKLQPKATATVGHRDLHGTDCPGSRVYALVKAREFQKLPPAPEDDMPTAAEVAKALLDQPIQSTWHNTPMTVRTMLQSMYYYTVEAGCPTTRPAGNKHPNTPTMARVVLDRLGALDQAVDALDDEAAPPPPPAA